VALGVLAVLGGGLVAMQTFRSVSHRQPVLMVARDVPTGHQVTAADLTTADVSADSGVHLLGVTAESTVVGKWARVPLVSGSLMTGDEVTSVRPLPPDEGVAPVPLPIGQVPPGLSAGAAVEVLVLPSKTPTASAATDAGATDAVRSFRASVFSVGSLQQGASVQVVSVQAKLTDIAAMAPAAADGRVTLVAVGS
jgi:hypothetical protein